MGDTDKMWSVLVERHRMLLGRDDWRRVIDSEGVRGFVLHLQGGAPLVRCDTSLRCRANTLRGFLVTDILETLPKWNPVFDGGQVLEDLGDGERILRLINRLPWPLRRREDVFYNGCKEDDDGTIIEVSAGMEHAAAPLRKDMIRSGLEFASKQMTPRNQDACDLIVIWQYDLRGVLGSIGPRSMLAGAMLRDLAGECRRLRERFGAA